MVVPNSTSQKMSTSTPYKALLIVFKKRVIYFENHLIQNLKVRHEIRINKHVVSSQDKKGAKIMNL